MITAHWVFKMIDHSDSCAWLTLLRYHYAPLVVARHHRAEYLEGLDTATDGDLRPLVRLFARLESVALRSELIRPMEAVPTAASVVEAAWAYTDRLLALRQAGNTDKRERVSALAVAVHESLNQYLSGLRRDLAETFRSVDDSASSSIAQAIPGSDRGYYWRAQSVATANESGGVRLESWR